MKLMILAQFLFNLNVLPYQKKALSACTMYQRRESEITYALLCGCAKTLHIYSEKLTKVCPKESK